MGRGRDHESRKLVVCMWSNLNHRGPVTQCMVKNWFSRRMLLGVNSDLFQLQPRQRSGCGRLQLRLGSAMAHWLTRAGPPRRLPGQARTNLKTRPPAAPLGATVTSVRFSTGYCGASLTGCLAGSALTVDPMMIMQAARPPRRITASGVQWLTLVALKLGRYPVR